MFSTEDIRHLTGLFLPENVLEPTETALSDVPALLISPSGDGLVSQKHTSHEFERFVRSGSEFGRLSLSVLAHTLDVHSDVVLKFVKIFPHLALTSADNDDIVPKAQRDSLWRKLREAASSHVVMKKLFSQENNVSIESIDALARSSLDSEESPDDLLVEISPIEGPYIVSQAYESALQDTIQQSLQAAQKDAEHVTFSPKELTGEPPVWYISKTIDTVLEKANEGQKWYLDRTLDAVHCTPQESLRRRRDVRMEQLNTGTMPYIDFQDFAGDFGELYPSFKDVRDYFSKAVAKSPIDIIGAVAISKTWLDNFKDECMHTLERKGYADVITKIIQNFPMDYQSELRSRIKRLIISACENQPDTPIPYMAGSFIMTEKCRDSYRGHLISEVGLHAKARFQALEEDPDKELRFQISDLLNQLPSRDDVFCALAEDISKDIERQYWNDISNLESKNEAEFSAFWIDRVVPRLNIYVQGLNAIEDSKLRGQLSDLLSTYVVKELFPDTVSKARSQGLTRSRKTRKNVQKLENILKSGKMDIGSVVSAIEKFDKKQGIKEPDTASLADMKRGQVDDMVRKMQKQSDGPLLFLTLVVVLLAKHQPGMVYATGKFAPRLMRQLKSSLKVEEYEQLEKWKDLAKAGALSAEDKEGIKRLAG
ncbi:hypothetical protein K469DRAFT_708591 [Zopfia rhizophila CBS 207.26]|uniref:Uncharacterized protein n=1 Tax=Zopfia rhizophila CBS 207.26 TaxID=1314779 RepID=A0A6A6E280_9PEZI|nr:hypothetical protein K469DRAFT_708591 [Zopfia rhizophila CBS 207.26]